MAEPKDPTQPKLRDWPMFLVSAGKHSRRADGRPLPRISELLLRHVEGTPSEKLAWLQRQKAAGRLDGDDADEIAEAETLLVMLARFSAPKGRKEKRHLDELLDEGLRGTFPASDPVSVGHFTGTEAPTQPIDRPATDSTGARKTARKTRAPRTHTRVRRYG